MAEEVAPEQVVEPAPPFQEVAPKVSAQEQVDMVNFGDAMRKALKEAPKRTIMVPSSSDVALRSAWKDHIVVTLNGIHTFVPVDQPTSVPENVALVIEEVLVGEAANKKKVKEMSDRSRGPVLFEIGGSNE